MLSVKYLIKHVTVTLTKAEITFYSSSTQNKPLQV